VQNELLELVAHDVRRRIIGEILHSSSRYFSVIVDETTDISTKEQVSICLRWHNDDLEPVEEFVVYQTASTTRATSVRFLEEKEPER